MRMMSLKARNHALKKKKKKKKWGWGSKREGEENVVGFSKNRDRVLKVVYDIKRS